MPFRKKWDEIMGPKDERLEAEESKSMKAMANILLAGTIITLYYNLSLEQVAYVTEHPIMTSLGESVNLTQLLLIITILAGATVGNYKLVKAGFFSTRKRFAEVDRIPWDFVALVSAFCGVVLGVLTCGLRIVAEIQIVGIDGVMWFGDLAIGAVFFWMGFILCFVLMGCTIHDAIKQRRRIEAELDN